MKTRRDFVRLPVLSVLLAGALFAVGAAVVPVAQAQTFKFANQGDALSMDPHSLNESFQLAFTGNIYEPLIGRGKKLELVPALATEWKQTSPTVWRFNLRKNVKFHDGTPFTADDVIFSYARAQGARLRREDLRRIDQGNPQDRRPHGRHRHQRALSHPAGRRHQLVHHVEEVVRGEPRHAAGRQAQGRREHGVVQGQRHRPVPPAARASRASAPRCSATPTTGARSKRNVQRSRSSRRSAIRRRASRRCCRARST